MKRFRIKVLIPSDEFDNHYRVIHHRIATQTYLETIERMDIHRILQLRLEYGRLPFVSMFRSNIGRQKEIDNFYVKTPTPTGVQAEILVELAHKLDIDLIVFHDGRHLTYDNVGKRLKRSELSEIHEEADRFKEILEDFKQFL